MRYAYIAFMDASLHATTDSSGSSHDHIHALPASDASDTPTVGAIKRALHELSRTTSGSTQRDSGAVLREAHELLLGLARRNGINPDNAVQRRRAAVKLQRERMVLASVTASDQMPR
jgi:hypothetical protein